MPQLLTCPHGHQWEASDEARTGSESDPSACPVCGAHEVKASAETVGSAPSSEATLPAPRREVPAPQPADGPDLTLAMPAKSASPAGASDLSGAPKRLLPASSPGDTLATEPPSDRGGRRGAAAADGTLPLSDLPAAPAADGTLPLSDLPAAPAAPASLIDATLPAPPSGSRAGGAGAKSAESSRDGTKVLSLAQAVPAPAASAGTAVIDPSEDGTRRRPRQPEPSGDLPTRVGDWKPAAPAGVAVGPAIPGYKVLGELGRGGMGVVYKAQQLGLNRLVAVKMILSGDYAGRDELARFRLEAEAVAKLQHPGIVQVYEINELEGKPYFCLEFVEGGPLDKKLAGNPQPARQAAELVEKLAQAMAYAHDRHIIHRDLKPANILLTPAGEPKITDFGLAKRLDSEDMHTQSGAVMGTPSYMAPEQAHGRTKEIGPAADIYSLGAILYELLVGRPPFKGETVIDTLDQVRTLEPAAPSRLRPKLPRDLETICLKCLHKEPARRYGGAHALAEDLRRYLAGEPILARPTPWWERSWKLARRRPAWAALTATAALFVLALIGGGFAFGMVQHEQMEQEMQFNKEIMQKNQLITEKSDEVTQQLGQARGNFHLAEDTYRTMLGRVFAERLRYEPKMEQMRRQVLADALNFNELLLKTYPSDPEAQREIGRAHMMEGEVLSLSGDPKNAEQHYQSADHFRVAARHPPERSPVTARPSGVFERPGFVA